MNKLRQQRSWLIIAMAAAIFLHILVIIPLTLVPPVSRDALVHHLAVPKLYLNHGGIYEIPFMEFSYYPMNLNLLYLIPLYFGNDIAPKFIHFSFALLTAGLIFSYLREKTCNIYALMGAVFFLSLPVIVKLSITVYVDLGEIFFSLAALVLILKWLSSGFKTRFLIYAGLMCGLALGTKYNGLVTFVTLALLVPCLYSRYGPKIGPGLFRPAAYVVIFLLVSLFVFSPWMIRNYHWKSNPVYPLYDEVFNPSKDIRNDIVSDGTDNAPLKMNQGIFTYRSVIYNETGWQIALLPVRIFFQGKDNDPQYFDGRLNPFLFILPFFAFYRLREDPEDVRREKKILLAFSLLFFGFAFFSVALRMRYIAPIIPPLVMLSVFGAKKIFDLISNFKSVFARRTGKAFVAAMLIFFLGLNASYIAGQYRYVDPWPYIKGEVDRDEYISRYIPEYPAVRYINDNLDARAKILFILIGNRGYYCDRNYSHDMEIMKTSTSQAEKPPDIMMELQKQGITHLLINYRLFERWVNDNFDEEEKILLGEFFKGYTSFIFEKNGFGVLGLK